MELGSFIGLMVVYMKENGIPIKKTGWGSTFGRMDRSTRGSLRTIIAQALVFCTTLMASDLKDSGKMVKNMVKAITFTPTALCIKPCTDTAKK